jgi:hypothetical protein
MFVAADEVQLATAREAMRRSLAWASIIGDGRLMRQTLTQGQAADAEEKARNNREGARRAVRSAWSHILYAEKSDATTPGKASDLEHLGLATKDRSAIPVGVYDKDKGDDIVKEKLGSETMWLKLKDLWPAESPHLAISEIAEWFSAHAYLPKLRDRVVLETSIRDAIGKFDAAFGYAERFDAPRGFYDGLIYAKAAPEILSPGGLLVRADVAKQQAAVITARDAEPAPGGSSRPMPAGSGYATVTGSARMPAKPRRFFGSVEIDMNRPVKAFDAIINAVVMELQRSPGAKVKLTLEIEAEAPSGFNDVDVGVVRDNTKQLKFRAEATGFE